MSAREFPCDDLREPFHSSGYCLNCHMAAALHTEEGWRRYYNDQASGCEHQAATERARADELDAAARRARRRSSQFRTVPVTAHPAPEAAGDRPPAEREETPS